MTLDEAVERYLDHVRVERGLSAHTVSAYGSDLSGFVRFAEEQGVRAISDADAVLFTTTARLESSISSRRWRATPCASGISFASCSPSVT